MPGRAKADMRESESEARERKGRTAPLRTSCPVSSESLARSHYRRDHTRVAHRRTEEPAFKTAQTTKVRNCKSNENDK